MTAIALVATGCNNDDDDVLVTSVEVTPSEFSVKVQGDLPTLEASVKPANATDKTVKWSSDKPAILSVDENTGALKWEVAELEDASAVVTITASAGGVSGKSVITVTRNHVPVEAGTITASKSEFHIGEALPTLTVAWTPEGATTPETVAWGSDNVDILKINTETGALELVAESLEEAVAVKITAVAMPDDVTAETTITVKPAIVLESISVTASAAEFVVGDELPTVEATLNPEGALGEVVWSSDKPEILAVDAETGVLELTAEELAEAADVVITATVGEISGNTTIKVKPVVPVTGITVTASVNKFAIGDELPTLEAVVAPEDATSPTVTWSSDKPEVLAVNAETGVLELIAETLEADEAVTITATADGVSGEVVITVQPEAEA